MATERLSMRKTREMLRQRWQLGRTHREIAASVGQLLGAVATTVSRARAVGLDRPATQALKRHGSGLWRNSSIEGLAVPAPPRATLRFV